MSAWEEKAGERSKFKSRAQHWDAGEQVEAALLQGQSLGLQNLGPFWDDSVTPGGELPEVSSDKYMLSCFIFMLSIKWFSKTFELIQFDKALTVVLVMMWL